MQQGAETELAVVSQRDGRWRSDVYVVCRRKEPMSFSNEFRRNLVDKVEPPLCPLCFLKNGQLQWPTGRDFRKSYAVGIAARLSYASDIAAIHLGWDFPWKLAHVVHMVAVPTEHNVSRMLLIVGERKYAENIRLVWPCEEYEALCQRVALDVAEGCSIEHYTSKEVRESLELQLKLHWKDADFHVCGKSTTLAVARVVKEFAGVA